MPCSICARNCSTDICMICDLTLAQSNGIDINECVVNISTPAQSARNSPSESSAETVDCSICTVEINSSERKTLTCGHNEFHAHCVDRWLNGRGQGKCPMCRTKVGGAHSDNIRASEDDSEDEEYIPEYYYDSLSDDGSSPSDDSGEEPIVGFRIRSEVRVSSSLVRGSRHRRLRQPRLRCEGMKRTRPGERCHFRAVNGARYCRHHIRMYV